MAKRLLSYPVSDDAEATSLKQRLDEAGIEYYETPGSRWGFSHPAIWIRNEQDLVQAKQVLEQHMSDYASQARRDYQRQTGYDPQAPLPRRIWFNLYFLWHRKTKALLLLLALFLIGSYIYALLGLFQ